MANCAFITVDCGFGDCGKGTFVDSLVRKYKSNLVVRYSGGSQCAHRVVLSDGKTHVFSQFGSGTLVAGTRTLLSKHVLINPVGLLVENQKLEELGITDCFKRMFIHEEALITTPFHKAYNRILENSRGDGRHGSCGMGIGATMQDFLSNPNLVLRFKDIKSPTLLMEKLIGVRSRMFELASKVSKNDKNFNTFKLSLEDLISNYKTVANSVVLLDDEMSGLLVKTSEHPIFEAAQGIGIDENFGFFPHTTWTTVTSKNAEEILKGCDWTYPKKTIGITRAYTTRHGAGPLVTEDEQLTDILPDDFNKKNEFQGGFRVGWLDLNLLAYCMEVNGGIDYLAISHLDKLSLKKSWKICLSYYDKVEWELHSSPTTNIAYQSHLTERMNGSKPKYVELGNTDIISFIANYLETPVLVTSKGPTPEDKNWLLDTEKACKNV